MRGGGALERYLYLGLAMIYLLGTGVVWVTRRDLRRAILAAGPVGSGFEIGTDLRWYLHDYWHPPTVLAGHLPLVEDAIFGFGVTALAACAVAYWIPPPSWRRNVRRYRSMGGPARRTLAWGLVGLVATLILYAYTTGFLVQVMHLNSIWAVSVTFAVIGLLGLVVRPDLWWAGLVAGVIMTAVAFIGYFVGLDVVIKGDVFLHHVYLPYHTNLDVRVPGTNVLVDELVWNFCRGWCVAIVYPTLANLTFERLCLPYRHVLRPY